MAQATAPILELYLSVSPAMSAKSPLSEDQRTSRSYL